MYDSTLIYYSNCSLVGSLNLSAVLLISSVCGVCKINVIASIMSIIGKTCLRIGAYLILHRKQCNIKYIALAASLKNAHAIQ